MAPTLTHIVAVVAGLAIVAAGFTVLPGKSSNGLLKGVALAVALAVAAACLIVVVRQFG
jgi:hypothetical protein